MLTKDILTLVNPNSLALLPFILPNGRRCEYQARVLLGGSDAAIEMTASTIDLYVDGVICEEPNGFTHFVAKYLRPLAEAYHELSNDTGATVVIVGRWHVQDVGNAHFEAYVRHVIEPDGALRSWRYDLSIFDNDDYQNGMTVIVEDEIKADLIDALNLWARNMTSPLSQKLTAYRVPLIDGVAWLSDQPDIPHIFCHFEWPSGLSRRSLEDILKLSRIEHPPILNDNSI